MEEERGLLLPVEWEWRLCRMCWCLESSSFCNLTVKTGSGKYHPQMLNLGGNSAEDQDVYMALTCLPTDCLLGTRGKIYNYTVDKLNTILTMWSKQEGQMTLSLWLQRPVKATSSCMCCSGWDCRTCISSWGNIRQTQNEQFYRGWTDESKHPHEW